MAQPPRWPPAAPHLIEVICLTTSAGECRSMRRLWMRISKRSQVLVPSPQGDLRVVMRSTLVGMRTGPLTLSCLSLAPRIRSAHTAGLVARRGDTRAVERAAAGTAGGRLRGLAVDTCCRPACTARCTAGPYACTALHKPAPAMRLQKAGPHSSRSDFCSAGQETSAARRLVARTAAGAEQRAWAHPRAPCLLAGA